MDSEGSLPNDKVEKSNIIDCIELCCNSNDLVAIRQINPLSIKRLGVGWSENINFANLFRCPVSESEGSILLAIKPQFATNCHWLDFTNFANFHWVASPLAEFHCLLTKSQLNTTCCVTLITIRVVDGNKPQMGIVHCIYLIKMVLSLRKVPLICWLHFFRQ